MAIRIDNPGTEYPNELHRSLSRTATLDGAVVSVLFGLLKKPRLRLPFRP